MHAYMCMWYSCALSPVTIHYSVFTAELVEGAARITEARLKREVGEGKIVDFWRTDRGYEVIRLEALSERENKVRIH